MYLPHRAQVLFWGSFGFVGGVTAVFVLPSIALLFWSFFLLIFCLFLGVLFSLYRKCFVRTILIGATFLIAFIFGVLRTDHALVSHDEYIYADAVISGIGEVVREPRRSERFLNFEVDFLERDLHVLIRGPKYTDLSLGDRLDVRCALAAPESFDQFDYPRYLQMRGVDYLCEKSVFEKLDSGSGFLARLARFRRGVEHDLNQLIRAPESGLASGLLFGGDDRLSQSLQDAFARTGMSHIVAVSGYNVSVIIMVITVVGIYFGLWRKHAALLSVVAIILFVAMIGFPSSGVRAALMGGIVLAALLYGRAAHAVGAVLFASALMLLYNPLQIAYDVGFQLSFAAVLGIMAFMPILESLMVYTRRAVFIREILLVTISAQIFVLPIIAYHFQTFSSTSLLTNMLVLPVLPFTMFFVFMTAVLSQIWTVLALPFALLSQFLLTYEIAVIEYFANKSWSVVLLETFSWSFAIGYYALLLIIIICFAYKGRYKK